MSRGRGWGGPIWTCSSSTGEHAYLQSPSHLHITYADVLQGLVSGQLTCSADSNDAIVNRHDYGQRNYVAAAQQLADMQAAGKLRRIGLTNFDVRRTAELLDAGVPLVSNQVILVQEKTLEDVNTTFKPGLNRSSVCPRCLFSQADCPVSRENIWGSEHVARSAEDGMAGSFSRPAAHGAQARQCRYGRTPNPRAHTYPCTTARRCSTRCWTGAPRTAWRTFARRTACGCCRTAWSPAAC
jgi:hypothetical protein